MCLVMETICAVYNFWIFQPLSFPSGGTYSIHVASQLQYRPPSGPGTYPQSNGTGADAKQYLYCILYSYFIRIKATCIAVSSTVNM